MGHASFARSVFDRNVVMRRMTVVFETEFGKVSTVVFKLFCWLRSKLMALE